MINVPKLDAAVRLVGGEKLIARDHGMPVNPFAPCGTNDNNETRQITHKLTNV